MTLKEFAAANGIKYRTAQTWLRRGRIQQDRLGEFTLVESLNPESLNPESQVESSIESRVESLNPESCAGCAKLEAALNGAHDRIAELETQFKVHEDWTENKIEAIEGALEMLATIVNSIQARAGAAYGTSSRTIQWTEQ